LFFYYKKRSKPKLLFTRVVIWAKEEESAKLKQWKKVVENEFLSLFSERHVSDIFDVLLDGKGQRVMFLQIDND
jgi:hypothetical protein